MTIVRELEIEESKEGLILGLTGTAFDLKPIGPWRYAELFVRFHHESLETGGNNG